MAPRKTSPAFDVIHERLREARENAGLTLDDMAAALKISKTYAGELERIKTPGVWKHVVKWADVTGVAVGYLLDDPHTRNPERVPGSEYTPESLAAMREIDALPAAARLFVLNAVREYTTLFRALIESQTNAARLLLLLAELNVKAEDIQSLPINPSTVNEALEQLLGRLQK